MFEYNNNIGHGKWCYTVLSIEFLLLCYGHKISKIFIYYPLNIKLFSFICIFVWLGPLLSGTLGRWIHLNIDIKRLFAETKHVLFLWEWIRLWTSKWWHMHQNNYNSFISGNPQIWFILSLLVRTQKISVLVKINYR